MGTCGYDCACLSARRLETCGDKSEHTNKQTNKTITTAVLNGRLSEKEFPQLARRQDETIRLLELPKLLADELDHSLDLVLDVLNTTQWNEVLARRQLLDYATRQQDDRKRVLDAAIAANPVSAEDTSPTSTAITNTNPAAATATTLLSRSKLPLRITRLLTWTSMPPSSPLIADCTMRRRTVAWLHPQASATYTSYVLKVLISHAKLSTAAEVQTALRLVTPVGAGETVHECFKKMLKSICMKMGQWKRSALLTIHHEWLALLELETVGV